MTTLRELLNEHPNWIDLPIVAMESDGSQVCCQVFEDVDHEDGAPVLVFSPN